MPRPRSERRTVADKLVVSVARLVDNKGDLLVLDNMGISLQVNTCFCGEENRYGEGGEWGAGRGAGDS